MATVATQSAALIGCSCPSIPTHYRRKRQRSQNDLFGRIRSRTARTSYEAIISPVRSSSSSSSSPEGGGGAGNGKTAFISQEDVKYLVKLGGGSVAGAAAIKYGSVLFPTITQPNLTQALLMIIAPVLVALWLLIRQSGRVD